MTTSEVIAMAVLAVLLFAWAAVMAVVIWRFETQHRRGYTAGTKPVVEYRRPPKGPAPGGKR